MSKAKIKCKYIYNIQLIVRGKRSQPDSLKHHNCIFVPEKLF